MSFTINLFTAAQIPAEDGYFWYKGNTHTHAQYSDDSEINDVPEIAKWYMEAGYNFLLLSEHNDHLLRRKTYCYDYLSRPKKNFIMICGLELSQSRHITALGINRFIAGEKSLKEGVTLTLEAGGVPILNHPMDPVVTARKFISTEGLNHIEIVNGGRLHDTPASIALWDSVMSDPEGRIIYAVAADDNHYSKKRVGKGWIMVLAKSLTKDEIKESIRAGNFYPTTGIILNKYKSEGNVFNVSSQNGDTIKFFGRYGKLLETSAGKDAKYIFRGNEKYVRAEITGEDGKKAWTQPVMIPQESPAAGRSWQYVALRMPDEWYGSDESVKIAENVLLYQRNSGGWPKNTAMHLPLTDSIKAIIKRDKEINDAIFDNSATTTEMRFLAKMYNKTKKPVYRESFNRGLKFILDAQYENGGWPMFWPLRKGYYTHITFNDNAIVNILALLRDIINNNPLLTEITDLSLKKAVETAYGKGIEIILRTQITVNGKPTVWCAQHDENTLEPAAARSYELPSFSGGESAALVNFLMEIPDPSPEIIRSLQGAVEWFEAHRIRNIRWDYFTNNEGMKDRRIVYDPAAGDLWARFYDLETGEPFFCDRDGIKKKSLEEIGYERRNGYSWYTDAPQNVIDKYPEWKARWVR